MSLYTFNIVAGVPTYVKTPGSVLLVDSISVATGVDITLIKDGAERPKMPGRKAAFKINDVFDELILASPVNITVGIFIGFTDVNLGFQDGANINVPNGVQINNLASNPVPVAFSGTVSPVLGSVNVNNTPAQAVPVTLHGSDDTVAIPIQKTPLSTLVDIAPVVAGLAAVALVNDPTLKRLTIRNASNTATVAIGGAAVTMSNGARVLGPGDIWVEEDAAAATWYVISNTAQTNVQISGLRT